MKHGNLLFAALGDVIRHRLRSGVVVLCLTAVLLPLVTALAISEGLRSQARIGVLEGAEVYVSRDICGANGPLSSSDQQRLSQLHGIPRAVGRIVGRTYFVDRLVAVVGLEEEALAALKPLVIGDIPGARGDVIVGEGIARGFGIRPGPGMRFTVAANNRKVFKPTGILRPSCLWSSDILLMRIEDANEFFRTQGQATQLLIYGDPGSGSATTLAGVDWKKEGLRVETRRRVAEHMSAGYGHTGGIFIVLFVVGAALAIPALLVTSGLGIREDRREIGVLKATGWRIRDVLEKIAFQNLTISLAAACLSILASMLWIKGMNGALIAQFYIAEVGLFPSVDIPSRYLPTHALFCVVFGLTVTLVGALGSTWRKTRLEPCELMR
jgi:ABC-type lipoprotein release transport system permease subunit